MKLLGAAAVASMGIASVLAVYACATRREVALAAPPLASTSTTPEERPPRETPAPFLTIAPPEKPLCTVRGERADIDHLLLATPSGPEVVDLRTVAASAALSADRTIFMEAHDRGVHVRGYVNIDTGLQREHDRFFHPSRPLVFGGVFFTNGKASFAFDRVDADKVAVRFPPFHEYMSLDVACADLSLDVSTFDARVPVNTAAPLRDAWATSAPIAAAPPVDESSSATRLSGVVHVLREDGDYALVAQSVREGEFVGWVPRAALGPLPIEHHRHTPVAVDLMMATVADGPPPLSVTCKEDIPLLVRADDDRLYVVGSLDAGRAFTAIQPIDIASVELVTSGITFRWPVYVSAPDLAACEVTGASPPSPPDSVEARIVSAPPSLACASHASSALAKAAAYCYGVYLDGFRVGKRRFAPDPEAGVAQLSWSTITLTLEVGPEGDVHRASSDDKRRGDFRMGACLEVLANEIVLPCGAGGAADATMTVAVDLHPLAPPPFDQKAARERRRFIP
jgi:hypothetical protein